MVMIASGRTHHGGEGEGPALVLDEPLSLWGGVDPATGIIVDQHHPQVGQTIAGTVLVMPHGRGSSGGSGILAESLRASVGPAAIVMRELDAILLVGAIVADELYGIACPVVELSEGYERVRSGTRTTVSGDGTVRQA